MRQLPRAILFDLDDTLLSAYRDGARAWRTVLDEHAAEIAPFDAEPITRAIVRYAAEFWSDADRHRYWRLRLQASRREIVRGAFAKLQTQGQALSEALAVRIADRFTDMREEQMYVFPGALETLASLRERGVRLALVTNGHADSQRPKLVRFDLARHFDHIQIESEQGFGKPEERAYRHALQALGVAAHEAWMVGDNLEWEVAAPQRLGIYAVWHDVDGKGLPPGSTIKPDRIVRAVSELLDAGAAG